MAWRWTVYKLLHEPDNIFRWIFTNKKFCTLIKISLIFVSKGPIDNNPALVKIMAWRRIGDKPLSEPMLTWSTDAYMRHYGRWVKEHFVLTMTSQWDSILYCFTHNLQFVGICCLFKKQLHNVAISFSPHQHDTHAHSFNGAQPILLAWPEIGCRLTGPLRRRLPVDLTPFWTK